MKPKYAEPEFEPRSLNRDSKTSPMFIIFYSMPFIYDKITELYN